jgi:hypothetical protein
MKRGRLILIVLAILLTHSCTTVPTRFKQNPQISPHGGYVIESEDAEGFYLEVFYKSYSFLPNPDDNIQEAKSFFVRVAQDLARERGKALAPTLTSQLKTNATRNILDGYYAVYVSGRVKYAP